MTVNAVVLSHDQTAKTCGPDDDLMEAVDRMIAENVNAFAVVGKGGRLAGILTDHDIIRALSKHKGQLAGRDVRVSDEMTVGVITCTPETRLSQALSLMGHHRIRHLVVVDGDAVVAALSIKDILQKIHQNEQLEKSILRDIAVATLAFTAD